MERGELERSISSWSNFDTMKTNQELGKEIENIFFSPKDWENKKGRKNIRQIWYDMFAQPVSEGGSLYNRYNAILKKLSEGKYDLKGNETARPLRGGRVTLEDILVFEEMLGFDGFREAFGKTDPDSRGDVSKAGQEFMYAGSANSRLASAHPEFRFIWGGTGKKGEGLAAFKQRGFLNVPIFNAFLASNLVFFRFCLFRFLLFFYFSFFFFCL